MDESVTLPNRDMEVELQDLCLQGRRVLVIPEKPSEMTSGGVLLPAAMLEKVYEMRRGLVVLVGPGDYEFGKFVRPAVEEGDTAIYSGAMGIPFKYKDFDYLLLQDQDIVAYICCGVCPKCGIEPGVSQDLCTEEDCPCCLSCDEPYPDDVEEAA